MPNYLLAVEHFIDADGSMIRAAGFVTRDLAHSNGVPHTTVLIVPIRRAESGTVEILIHRRPPDKMISPDTWDTFGGHVEVAIENGQLQPPADKIQQPDVLHRLIDDTAIREANEEIEIPEFQFNEQNTRRFGGYGDFDFGVGVPGSKNVEYSTLFVAALPPAATSITAHDTVGMGGSKLRFPI